MSQPSHVPPFRINLIFSPLVSPSCIPIGIASLKAYLERCLPSVHVRAIDLSLPFVQKALDGRFHDLHHLCKAHGMACVRKNGACHFRGRLLEPQRRIFKQALAIIKNKKLFFDEEVFSKYIGDCASYTASLDECLTRILVSYNESRLRENKALAEYFKDEIDRIIAGKPNLIGFSVLVDSQIHYALAFARMVRQRCDIPIVFGGPALFNFVMEEFMAAFDFIDFAVVKEGELSLCALARHMQTRGRRDYSAVPNLCWRKGSKIVMNPVQCIENLDELPTPDFDGLPLQEYFSPEVILPISSTRGCPWSRCKFCQLNAQYLDAYREKSIDKVLEDIRILQSRYGARDFFFTDSEISASRLKKLAAGIIGSKLQIRFGCYARPTKSLTPEILKAAYRAGCRFFQLGVESFSDRFLSFADKGTTGRSIRQVLKHTNSLGIRNLVYMLACCPRQTRAELSKDFKKIASLQKRYRIFSVMYCLYSLGIHQRWYREFNRRDIAVASSQPLYRTARGSAVCRTDCLDYTYRHKDAYHILNNRKDRRPLGYRAAQAVLDSYADRFRLNYGKSGFIYHINNFLFETQLLFCQQPRTAGKRSPKALAALEFYIQSKADLALDLYRRERINKTRKS